VGARHRGRYSPRAELRRAIGNFQPSRQGFSDGARCVHPYKLKAEGDGAR